MSDVFISHDTADKNLVIQLAQQLEDTGISTWYYERDAVPGVPHTSQTGNAIAAAKATLLVVSFSSIRSYEVNTEVNWTYSEHKSFVPVLVGITWAQFAQEKKDWQQLIGLSAGIEATPDNLPMVVSKIVMGLRQLDLAAAARPAPDSLPVDIPPLTKRAEQPPSAPRHNLPVQLTNFIGRTQEIIDVKRLLRANRLLTLIGPGGTGKTRLSLRAAAELLDNFADGVFFVSLAPISDPALVPSAITRALGLEGASGRSPLDVVKNYLGEKRLLLVMDNFEQVMAAAPLVAELLGAAPGLKVLITSRNVLHLYGEHDYVVPPLSLPDPKQVLPLEDLAQFEALQLFIKRAQAGKADFKITNENVQAVAQICQHLDGLPLAIELAAARIRLLAPHDILGQLGHRLKLLTGGGRDLPARHQTLRGAIAWSYDLLDESERRLFARLAVFVGGFTLEAAEAVCSGANDLPIDFFDRMGSLVDQSLLQRAEGEGPTRFRILETIREYAFEQLEVSGEASDVRRRHAEYYLAMAKQGELGRHGSDPRAWLDRLGAEDDNLLATLAWSESNDFEQALRLASALGWFWFVHGYRQEGLQRLHSLLARPEAGARTAARARALVEVVEMDDQPSSAVMAYAEEALNISRELGDKRILASACHWRAVIAYQQVDGQYDLALSLFQEALTLFRQFGNHWGITRAIDHMGIILTLRGDYPGARVLLEESLALCRGVGDKRGSANVLYNLASLEVEAGNLLPVQALLEESVALFREWGDTYSVSGPLWLWGEVLGRQGEYMLARQKVAEAYHLHQQLGEKQWAAYALWIMARVALAEGDAARAKIELRECLELGRKNGDNETIAVCIADFARLAAYSPGQSGRVARLLGAGERLIEGIAMGTWPSYRIGWDQAADTARLSLGEAAFAAAWAEGRAMTQDQAVKYALATDE